LSLSGIAALQQSAACCKKTTNPLFDGAYFGFFLARLATGSAESVHRSATGRVPQRRKKKPQAPRGGAVLRATHAVRFELCSNQYQEMT
jgi:hypothetical protein